ncbi:hypothetical protein K493DRAFT_407549 [Basidiobolus meristosporus CBS 931.73]|uniref:PAS domain-containing protein n=1 Tax=Basidiobolus meristosporus CBS 931.73 TaxID=1314790 RepID=A0A1Y1YCG0_9FUNG|nr:hypothetical protein K493DRAFT_407549 [Basidiobolus meristosporus CBS 931.73]|eukprot:ORX95652.1 hypothetical protein K493DRAFT_407549 [Basidiobolus meristosporus CBS 931.73]
MAYQHVLNTRKVNCIYIYDTSDEGRILYCSESSVDVTGYALEEVRGQSGYSFVESATSQVIREAGSIIRDEDNMATVMYTNVKHKDGGLVPIEAVTGRCYDIVVSVLTRADKGEPQLRARHATLQRTFTQQCDGTITTQESPIGYPSEKVYAKQPTKPSPNIKPIYPEPAACMIVDRFTRRLTIQFATKSCESLLGVNAKKCIGLPFLSYIDLEEVDSVVSDLETAKTNNSVAQIHFSFLSPQYRQSLPVRAAVFCANDGIIINVRLAKDCLERNENLVFLKYLQKN